MTIRAGRLRRIAMAGGHAGVLVFFITFLAFPFYWMLMTTFKTTNDLHDVNKTVATPLTDVPYQELVPGAAALAKLQKRYR